MRQYVRPPRFAPFSHRGRALAGCLVAVAVLAGPLAEAGAAKPAGHPVVGNVTSVAGSKRLYLRIHGHVLRTLRAGDPLHFGDVVLAGPAIQATLRVSRPTGVSTDADLIDVRPVGETPIAVVLQRRRRRHDHHHPRDRSRRQRWFRRRRRRAHAGPTPNERPSPSGPIYVGANWVRLLRALQRGGAWRTSKNARVNSSIFGGAGSRTRVFPGVGGASPSAAGERVLGAPPLTGGCDAPSPAAMSRQATGPVLAVSRSS